MCVSLTSAEPVPAHDPIGRTDPDRSDVGDASNDGSRGLSLPASRRTGPGVGRPRRFWLKIRASEQLNAEERAAVEEGAAYPVEEMCHLPEHEDFLDYLIDRSIAAWIRSQG